MGTTLTGTTPQDTYDSLIKVTDNGPLSGTLKTLTDGLGNDSTLSLSTSEAKVSGLLSVSAFTASDLSSSTQLNLTRTATQFTGIAIRGSVAADRALFSVGSDDALHIGRHAGGGGAWTKQVSFLDNGNVGIGTSSPDQKLNIAGSEATAYATSSGSEVVPLGGVNMTMQNTASGGFTSMRFVSLDSSNAIGYMGFTNTTSSIGGAFVFGQRSGGGYAEQVRIQAGGGISFNGDTAAANALDDYEEGTFTPTAFGATTAGTTTYNGQNGYYTKIGRQVTASLYVSYSSMTGTGTLKIGGLPFAIGNLTENYPVGSCIASAVNWTGGTYLQANGVLNESNLYVVYVSDDASANVQDCVDESANYRITITYFTA